MKFLESIRQKPDHVKGRIAFLMATILTGVTALVWVTTLPARFADMSTVTESGTLDETLRDLSEESSLQLGNSVGAEEGGEPQPVSESDLYFENPYDPTDAPLELPPEKTVPVSENPAVEESEASSPVEEVPSNIILNRGEQGNTAPPSVGTGP